MEYRFGTPDEFRTEWDRFVELVERGGQVPDVEHVQRGVEEAKALGFCYDGTELVGIAAVKTPLSRYTEGVFAKAGATELAKRYSVELGYAFVSEKHRGRGICKELVGQLLRRPEARADTFATTSAANISMQKVLESCSFVQSGHEYFGKSGNLLRLYVRHRQ